MSEPKYASGGYIDGAVTTDDDQAYPVVSPSVCRAALIDAAAAGICGRVHPQECRQWENHLDFAERGLRAALPLICERIASEIEAERDEDDDWDTAMAWLKSAAIARSFAEEAS